MIALPLVVIQQNIASYPVALSNFFYLESEPHPSLGKFQETDLALRSVILSAAAMHSFAQFRYSSPGVMFRTPLASS